MNIQIKPESLLCLLLLLLTPALSALSTGTKDEASFAVKPVMLPATSYRIYSDTVKYQGYRLHLTSFEILKKSNDWIKLKCTIVNSGRKDVDFSKKGTEHWVQVIFDQSLFDNQLGGLRDNILQAMYHENLQLAMGATLRGKVLKVSTLPLPTNQKAPEQQPLPELPTSEPAPEEALKIPVAYAEKGENPLPVQENADPLTEKTGCPDLLFTSLRILEQDDKWATVEYIIENRGEIAFELTGSQGQNPERLAIRAYISGVTVLSRGALPIGGQFVRIGPGEPKFLNAGEKYSGKLRLDIRKKTRYMKSLILSLESDQFHLECDKANNTGAVILD